MKQHIFGAIFLAVFFVVLASTNAHAETIQIQPLKVHASLDKSEKKKGFVDITNPTNEALSVDLYVNGFKQIDDKGNLKFFDDEQIKKGILLDFESASIGPHQTLRMYYIADGTKLPAGDVFATIFAQSRPDEHPGARTAVRVGTLLFIENQTKGARHTEIASLDMPFLQVGNSIYGVVSVKNPAPKTSTTGFFPSIKVEIQPWGGSSSFKGPLVFAGNTRKSYFELPSNQFGFYRINVTANDANESKIVFIATGWWRLAGPILVLLFVGIIWLLIKHRPYQKLRSSKHRQKPLVG